MLDDETFLKYFESAVFTPDQWHHREHIKAAYLYLRRHPFDAALDRMRASIHALNAAHHVPDELARGYHETMTQAWMRLVQVTLCEYGPADSADKFFEQHPQLGQNSALRFFYSRELLTSPRAKSRFVEPDLAPLPQNRKSPPAGSAAHDQPAGGPIRTTPILSEKREKGATGENRPLGNSPPW